MPKTVHHRDDEPWPAGPHRVTNDDQAATATTIGPQIVVIERDAHIGKQRDG